MTAIASIYWELETGNEDEVCKHEDVYILPIILKRLMYYSLSFNCASTKSNSKSHEDLCDLSFKPELTFKSFMR